MLAEITKHSIEELHVTSSNTRMRTLYTSEVFEDNAGCIVLMTKDEFLPKTKHLAIKWHHFKDQVRNGNVKVTKVDSTENWADIFTKQTDRQTFE